MPAADSTPFFKKYLKDNGLYSEERWVRLVTKGWDTMTNYAFAWGQIEQGKAPDAGDCLKVIAQIEGYDYATPSTWPDDPVTGKRVTKVPEPPFHLYNRTMHDTRVMTAIDMAKRWKSGEEQVRKNTGVERQDRRDRLRIKYGALSGCMVGEKEPSEALEDILHG